MPKYNHIYSIQFNMLSNKMDASDVTGNMLIDGLINKMSEIETEEEMEAAVETPLITYEVLVQ
jgi:hypothetical protein